jgi:hypothetical protein
MNTPTKTQVYNLVILDKSGTIVARYTTELTYDELKAAVEKALG